MNVRNCVLAAGALALTGSAMAADFSSVNSLVSDLRVFNDFGNSTLVTSTVGTSASLDEGPFGLPTRDNPFANKHRFFLSNDGASRIGLTQSQGWEMSVDYRVSTDFAGGNRKEGSIEFRVPLVNNDDPANPVNYFDEGRVLVWSTGGAAGEIAAFGGTMPFQGFGSPYANGDTVRLRLIYVPGDGVPVTGPQATIQIGYALNGGAEILGPANVWGDTRSDGFTNGTEVAFVAQNSPLGGGTVGFNQIVNHDWNNLTIVPAPGAAVLLGLAGLAGIRRRR